MNEVPKARAVLTKSQQLMERNLDEDNELGAEFIFFHFIEEDDPNDPEQCPEVTRTIAILAADWSELGAPDVLTVTIEPGDQMNKEQADAVASHAVNAIGSPVQGSMVISDPGRIMTTSIPAGISGNDKAIARAAAQSALNNRGMGRMGY